MNKLIDLRFVIGSFFSIVAILLLIYAFTSEADVRTINLWCGIVFLMFGLLMIILSFKKDAADEMLESDIQDPEDLKKIFTEE